MLNVLAVAWQAGACWVGSLGLLAGGAIWLRALRRARRARGPDDHRATCAVHWGESCSCKRGETT